MTRLILLLIAVLLLQACNPDVMAVGGKNCYSCQRQMYDIQTYYHPGAHKDTLLSLLRKRCRGACDGPVQIDPRR